MEIRILKIRTMAGETAWDFVLQEYLFNIPGLKVGRVENRRASV